MKFHTGNCADDDQPPRAANDKTEMYNGIGCVFGAIAFGIILLVMNYVGCLGSL